MFVRRDLPLAQQAVQACHACIEMARNLSPNETHPHLVLIGVKSEDQLSTLPARLEREGIQFHCFFDSDWDHQLMSIATQPVRGKRRRVFKRYQCLRGEPEEPDGARSA